MNRRMKNEWWKVLALAVLIGGGLSLLASPSPDGLEKVAEDQGFIDRAAQHLPGLIPDYQLPGIDDERLATSLAGIIGTLGVFGILFLAGRFIFAIPDQSKSTPVMEMEEAKMDSLKNRGVSLREAPRMERSGR